MKSFIEKVVFSIKYVQLSQMFSSEHLASPHEETSVSHCCMKQYHLIQISYVQVLLNFFQI